MNRLESQTVPRVDKTVPGVDKTVQVVSISEHQVILAKADRIGDLLITSDQARSYWLARGLMERHHRAQSLFAQLKNKTNKLLTLQQTLPADHPRLRAAVKETTDLEKELYGIPVAMQYKTAQADLNELVQGVFQLMIQRINQVVPVEPGPRQCGAAEGKGCSCGS